MLSHSFLSSYRDAAKYRDSIRESEDAAVLLLGMGLLVVDGLRLVLLGVVALAVGRGTGKKLKHKTKTGICISRVQAVC